MSGLTVRHHRITQPQVGIKFRTLFSKINEVNFNQISAVYDRFLRWAGQVDAATCLSV